MNYDAEKYIAVLHRELVPAMGCTEPIALAYGVATAKKLLGDKPEKICLRVSGNILKNGMGVGIPGTGMVGLEIAGAIGALGGNPDKGLNVLEDITIEQVKESKDFLKEGKVVIEVKEGVDPLYIEAELSRGADTAMTIIQGSHTNIVYQAKNEKVLLDSRVLDASKEEEKGKKDDADKIAGSIPDTHDMKKEFSVRGIYEFAVEMPFDRISFVYDNTMINEKLSTAGLETPYGHRVGQVIQKAVDKGLMGDSLMSYAIWRTAAATDARMAGCMLPAMSNSGSGNQGITVTMPVIAVAERLGSSKEELGRALTIASLMSIYIKSNMKRLSALCGAMTAGTAAACGMIYLMGGDLQAIHRGVQNMIGNLTGIICDGAKPNCAMKVATGVSGGVLAAILAMEGIQAEGYEGILDKDPDQSIRNLGKIAAYAMEETDREILRIMVSK